MQMISEKKREEMLEDLLEICRSHLSHLDEDMISRAFRLSFEAHKNDFRASGEPYFIHPYQVALIVASEMPLDDISVVVALLHDVVEDTNFSLDFVANEFSQEVADIVDGVTKISGVFTGYDLTQAENYRKLLLSMIKDIRVILVKFADRLHNMRTLEFVPQLKQRRIAKETMEIYAPFANRFGLGKVKWELEDLSFKYLNRKEYEQIAKQIKSKRRERESYIKKFTAPLENKLKEHGLKFEVSGRAKHIFSIYRKLIKQNTTFENIYDLFAIRIILESNDPNECYYVLGVVNQLYNPIDRFKDYISIPKKNNYQSIHNTVIGPDGRHVEIQIRTRKMHEIAEKGVAAHWKYKESFNQTDTEMEEWVNWVRDIFVNVEKQDAPKELLSSFKLNLYQDEIYAFTPKGDLRRLPKNSTPVDFAFDIHSKVGYNCIGAKVNGKIVPLNTVLNGGDQVDIITSKNQKPNKNWLQFVQTHKAKTNIRKYLNQEEEKTILSGKDIWEKKLKKAKKQFSQEEFSKIVRKQKFDNYNQFYAAIAHNKIDIEGIISPKVEEVIDEKLPNVLEFDEFAKQARTSNRGIIVDNDYRGIEHNFAKCCSPIPGDPIVGYITIGEGIKIHRRDCNNLIHMVKTGEHKLVKVSWATDKGASFVAGINIRGEDKPGLLTYISNSITSYNNTNIKAINISSKDSLFTGTVAVYVNDLEHLTRLIERLKKNKDIFSVERFDATS